ncbi:hypothetical protein B4U79_08404 [Dinothrombium tinctorium]|uniref:E3 ubiquitin-protein ligase n=1 Tax=Dinothrombium tinctorium TaxID=1965070 RepID=A0A443QK15_9ACAR|nr:hypothetical protein B4U79_08404 [Dinothrombium tinctorium]
MEDECPICMTKFGEKNRFAVKLKCEHVFCYFCVKGAFNLNSKCPYCREEISAEIVKKPKFLKSKNKSSESDSSEGTTKWFYKGANGWWVYDEDTCELIENAFRNKQQSCHFTISGLNYVLDFKSLTQSRVDDSSRRRKVKRDVFTKSNDEIKGIGGILKRDLSVISGSPKRKKARLVVSTSTNANESKDEASQSEG